jgi:hypothetical protein
MIIQDLGKYIFTHFHEVKGNTYCPGYVANVDDEFNVLEISKLSGRLGTLEYGWIANDLPVRKADD